MARVTHIAVNLSLIVALTMQPAFAYVVGQDCSADCTSGFTCQGCGCCKVQSETSKCPCCSGESEDGHKHDGCCGHVHDGKRQHSDDLSIDEADPFAGMLLEEGPVPEQNQRRDQPLEDQRQPTIKAAAPALAAACNCVTRPEPHEAPVPRSPVTELRDLLSLDIVVCGVMDPAEKPPLGSSLDDPHPAVAPHFSQVAFCVWRL